MGLDLRRVTGSEHELDPCPAAGVILEAELAGVVFHDLLHDRKSEAGALRAGRHIGFGQALALGLRQAAAIIRDDDRLAVLDQRQRDVDPARRRIGRVASGDGVDRVLEQIGQRLADLPRVENMPPPSGLDRDVERGWA